MSKSTTTTVLLTVEETGERLGVSVSTVWRLLRRGALRSVREGGRRRVPEDAVAKFTRANSAAAIAPLTEDHPLLRLAGAGRSGGVAPGARDKHAILDR